MRAPRDLHETLLQTAYEMTDQFDGLPAGSVMRCFFRAVHHARSAGVEPGRLPVVARRGAESVLLDRLTHGTRSASSGALRAAGR